MVTATIRLAVRTCERYLLESRRGLQESFFVGELVETFLSVGSRMMAAVKSYSH